MALLESSFQVMVGPLVDLLPSSVLRAIDTCFNRCGLTTPSEAELEEKYRKEIIEGKY